MSKFLSTPNSLELDRQFWLIVHSVGMSPSWWKEDVESHVIWNRTILNGGVSASANNYRDSILTSSKLL